ncbi:MAG: hypothetical protein GX111_11075 [Clostridiales bacterium]|jgi:hypothetical protein|nr:hypothetical protein [Clostridiales bacterium]
MKIRVFTAATCGIMFIVAFFSAIILLKSVSTNGAVPAAIETNVIVAEKVSENEDKYILKEYQGSICIFHGDFQDIPAIITDISVNDLTTKDRELLFQGIVVYGREALLKLLEDYGS